jgi:hypothetical protein
VGWQAYCTEVVDVINTRFPASGEVNWNGYIACQQFAISAAIYPTGQRGRIALPNSADDDLGRKPAHRIPIATK